VIFRDGVRVWEGPLTLATYYRDHIELQARDVMHYAYRLGLSKAYNNAYPNVIKGVERARNILTNELGRRETESPPINVVPFLTFLIEDDDAKTARSTTIWEKTAYEDVDDMAAHSGIDYTVIGRRIVVWDTTKMLGQTPVMTEADIIGEIVVTSYGMELATFAVSTGADGVYGTSGGADPYYGRWEIIVANESETGTTDSDDETTDPDQDALNSQSKANLAGRNPTPVMVRVPEGSQLSPDSPIKLEDLIPGVQVPLRATLTGRVFSQMQKLRHVEVSADESGEQIGITLVPAPKDARFPDGEE
jgi:hypothetical protein